MLADIAPEVVYIPVEVIGCSEFIGTLWEGREWWLFLDSAVFLVAGFVFLGTSDGMSPLEFTSDDSVFLGSDEVSSDGTRPVC